MVNLSIVNNSTQNTQLNIHTQHAFNFTNMFKSQKSVFTCKWCIKKYLIYNIGQWIMI
jgi:hypothetical protein